MEFSIPDIFFATKPLAVGELRDEPGLLFGMGAIALLAARIRSKFDIIQGRNEVAQDTLASSRIAAQKALARYY